MKHDRTEASGAGTVHFRRIHDMPDLTGEIVLHHGWVTVHEEGGRAASWRADLVTWIEWA